MYKYLLAILVSAVLNSAPINALTVSPEPCAVFYTPNSIIHRTSANFFLYVGDRARLSTCTGVAWFLDSRNFITANLLEHSMQTYGFIPDTNEIFQREKFNNDITLLGWPENLSISKDGNLLAISNSYRGQVNIFRLDQLTASIAPSPITQIEVGDHSLHGVRFSPDGNYLGYVAYDKIGKIRLFQMTTGAGGKPIFTISDSMDCKYEGVFPKGIDFSPDLKFIAICYSGKVRSGKTQITGKLTIFKFDAKKGIMDPNPVSEIGLDEHLNGPEDVLFYPDGSCFLVSNQGNDTVTVHDFDPGTGDILGSHVMLNSPDAELNFPHGMSISPDRKYLAVTNYGDDKICIYSLENHD